MSVDQESFKKQYVGDGVYASYDGYQLRLTTENGFSVLNEIFMEPQVFTNFIRIAGMFFNLSIRVESLKNGLLDDKTGVDRDML